MEIKATDGLVSLVAREVPLNRLLMLLGQQLNLNIVCANTATTPVSMTMDKVPLDIALTSLCSIAGCTWAQSGGIIHVTTMSAASKLPAEVQGRLVKVFRLDFASATDVDLAVKGMLSPVGQSFISKSMPSDNRRTDEVVVVQDLPGYVASVEQYIAQVDRPPLQVMIEAHVLSVILGSEDNCGIDFKYLFGDIWKTKFQTQGFADPTLTQSFYFTFDGSDLNLLVKALITQTNAKTMASPKVLAVNGQEARIQVGQQLGFRVLTTTETSTMESINFLDTGVVLSVTPRVTRDGRILMHVRPEVSKGKVNPNTGLPEQDTTHVDSSVMLPDGRGMVVGGLIQETDIEDQEKVTVLGDLWVVGRLFRHKKVKKERKEIIIVLLPRIVPDDLANCDPHALEVQRARTPLLEGALERTCRPWEASLPDAVEKPTRLRDHLPWAKHPACSGQACASDGPGGQPFFAEPYYAGSQEERWIAPGEPGPGRSPVEPAVPPDSAQGSDSSRGPAQAAYYELPESRRR